ncbi:MAG: hypothetical protein HUU08_09705 [Candidatus Brocadia sp.]|nr:hypothetical protein [Candidatus Brocadia sp.]
MHRKTILHIISVLMLSFSASIPLAFSERNKTLEITIDTNNAKEDLPYFFRSGMFTMEWYDKGSSQSKYDYIYEKYLAEHAPGLNTIYVPLWSGSLEDYKDKVENKGYLDRSIDKARKIRSAGGRVLFSFQDMPRWLSSAPPGSADYPRYPPADYEQWENLIAFTVDYLYKKGIIYAGYRIWEEADDDSFWAGTDEEFCRLYESSVKGIQSVDPNAKITFGNLSLALKDAPSETPSLLWKMIHYAAEKRLPLDYIIFHPFNFMPFSEVYENNISDVREELKNAGLDENIPFHSESWNSWLKDDGRLEGDQLDTRSQERDLEYNAANIISTLRAQNAGGVKYHAFYSDIDWEFYKYNLYGLKENQQFFGDFGIFTKDVVIKPSYNAFKALSLFAGLKENKIPRKIPVSMPDDDYVTALASQTQDKKITRILLSNFIPAESMASHFIFLTLKTHLFSIGYHREVMELILKPLKETTKRHPPGKDPDKDNIIKVNLSYLGWIVTNTDFPDPLDDLRIKKGLQSGFFLIQGKLDEMAYYTHNSREVELTVSNLPSGRYVLNTYLIDKEHSNSCRANKETELIPTDTPCGINGVVDKAVAKAKHDSKRKAKKETLKFLRRKGFAECKIRELLVAMKDISESCDADALCVRERLAGLCQQYPADCENIKDAYLLYKDVQQTLFYFGRYKYANPSLSPITIPLYIDRINSDKNLFKPLSHGPALFKKTTDITVPLEGSKCMTAITVNNGAYSTTLSLQPYSVMLIELFPAADIAIPIPPVQ